MTARKDADSQSKGCEFNAYVKIFLRKQLCCYFPSMVVVLVVELNLMQRWRVEKNG